MGTASPHCATLFFLSCCFTATETMSLITVGNTYCQPFFHKHASRFCTLKIHTPLYHKHASRFCTLKMHTPLYHKHASRFCTWKIHTPLYHKHARHFCIRKIHTHYLLQTRQEDTCSCKESLPEFVGFIFCLFLFQPSLHFLFACQLHLHFMQRKRGCHTWITNTGIKSTCIRPPQSKSTQ